MQLKLLQSTNTNDATGLVNGNFTSFTLNDGLASELKKYPPVTVPFGEFNSGTGSEVLLKQRIGSVETDYPLLVFNENLGAKSAVFVGDGLWRWRMYNFLQNENHNLFNEVVNKTINYLALKADKRKFRVQVSKNLVLRE